MAPAGFYGLDVYSLLESLESIIDYLKEKVGPCLSCLRHILAGNAASPCPKYILIAIREEGRLIVLCCYWPLAG
jgi:hypothetical protein